MPSSGSHRARASSATSGLLRLAGKRRTSTSRPMPAPVSRAARRTRSSGPWPTVSSGMGPAYPDAVEVRTALWRLPAMRSLVGVTVLGFTGYWLTLASLPAYAVAGGAAESTAGVVTAVFLVVTVAVQAAVPALTRRFGAGPVLIAGLLALGLPAPLYALSNGLAWLSWISAIRGAGFGVLTVLGSVLAVQASPEDRRGEAGGVDGLAIAVPHPLAVPARGAPGLRRSPPPPPRARPAGRPPAPRRPPPPPAGPPPPPAPPPADGPPPGARRRVGGTAAPRARGRTAGRARRPRSVAGAARGDPGRRRA